jgi:hypothetical protein
MSVFIYKNGEESLIPPEQLDEHLANGWSVTNDPKMPTKEEADTNGSGKLSNSEIRAAAKEAGIEGYSTKRIKALKEELGYGENTE